MVLVCGSIAMVIRMQVNGKKGKLLVLESLFKKKLVPIKVHS